MNQKLNELMNRKKVQRWVTRPNHIVTVGVTQHSERAIWSSATGHSEIGSDGIYEIGSITKTLTGLLLAIGEQQGLWKATDPLSSFISEWEGHPFAKETALLQLVTHTSGLPRLPKNINKTVIDRLNPYANYSEKDLMEAVTNEKLPRRRKWSYSNYGFGLLGWLLSKRVGKSLDEMMREWIFTPLNMRNSSVIIPESTTLLPVFKANDQPTKHWEFQDAMAGAGAVHSTVSDMLNYLEAHLNSADQSLQAALEQCRKEVHTMSPRMKTGIGYAWMIQHEKDGSITYWHNGATYGSCSFALFNREKQLGIVVLSNYGYSLLGELIPLKMSVDKLAKMVYETFIG